MVLASRKARPSHWIGISTTRYSAEERAVKTFKRPVRGLLPGIQLMELCWLDFWGGRTSVKVVMEGIR